MLPIIELFGLPGAGKTFLQEKLSVSLSAHRLRALKRNELILEGLKHRNDGWLTNLIKKLPARFWHKIIHEDYCMQELLAWSTKNMGFGQLVLAALGDACLSEPQCRSILGAFARTFVEYELLEYVPPSAKAVVLADEWFYHRFYTLFGNCLLLPSHEQIGKYIRSVPASDCAIFIATPPEICLQRMVQRRRFPVFLGELSFVKQKAFLENAYAALKKFVDELKLHGRSVAVYDGMSGDLQMITQHCLACVEKGPNR